MPITMHRSDTPLTVAEPLGMLEAGRKKARYFSYPPAVTEHRDAYESIFVAYADCGTGGTLQAACTEMGVEMIRGPHCYAFFEGLDRFAEISEDEFDAFYLTDFLVRQFEAFVWRPMGLDRHPELRDMYFAHYRKLVYQAQTDDAALTEKPRACADRLGL